MKTTNEVLNFCNEFTFYDHCIFERVIEVNHVRDYIIIVLSERDFDHADNLITVMSNIDDVSLKVIDGDIEKTLSEIIFLIVDLQMLFPIN